MGRRFLNGIFNLSGQLAGGCLVLILVLSLSRSLGRVFGFHIPASGEFVALLVAALTFLGLAYTFVSGAMIRVTQVIDLTNGRTRKWIEVIALIVLLSFLVYFAWYAGKFAYYSWLTNDRAQGLVPIPMWMPQITFVGGVVLFALAAADNLIGVLSGRLSPNVGPLSTSTAALPQPARDD